MKRSIGTKIKIESDDKKYICVVCGKEVWVANEAEGEPVHYNCYLENNIDGPVWGKTET